MNVQNDVGAYFKPYGLNIEKLFYAGTIRMPEQVRDQINQRIANEQAALAAQANVATATANAQAKIEQAKGDSEANKLIADSIHANRKSCSCGRSRSGNGVLPGLQRWRRGPCPSSASRVSERDGDHDLPQPPGCGTSRKVLAALRDGGHAPQVVEYLKAGWTEAQLRDLFGRWA